MKPPPPPPLLFSQNSKKRLIMDPDVIEIPPLVSRTNKQPKQKQVILNEVIDVDNYEGLDDVMIIDEKIDGKNKGKAVKSNSDGYKYKQAQENIAKLLSGLDDFNPDSAYDEHNDDTDDDYNDSVGDVIDDFMDFDDYGSLQAHFDNVNIPPGVEAPVPWWQDPLSDTNKIVNESNSSSAEGQIQSNAADFWSSKPAHANKELSSVGSSSYGMGLPPPWSFGQTTQMMMPPLGVPQFFPEVVHSPLDLNKQGGTGNTSYPAFPSHTSGLNHPPVGAPHMSWFTPKSLVNHSDHPILKSSLRKARFLPEEGPPRSPKNVNIEDVLRKFQLFKRFDVVEDHSDHHYNSKSSSTKQPPKNWAKRIQDEWRILENDLPDSIFVRVYETRMDLLRAVIVGAEGTPYHDGLFFFDVFFPRDYPNVPPHVYYHSGGLRLNPNLYSSGKVCLSLLGTWHGNENENWLPGVSTVLQVLVSIQALILNQKPFYNEPGYEHLSGSAKGESQSQQYNENAFMLSLKTMVYTMRKPPKHFEDFVMGHFHMHAKDIVVACKAYMQGAQVGCLVKGGIQDVDEGDKSCSKSFKETLPPCVDMLVKEFSYIGVKDTENLRALVRGTNNLTA